MSDNEVLYLQGEEFISLCVEAEKSLLSIFFFHPDTFEDFKDRVSAEVFYDGRNAALYELLIELHQEGAVTDYTTVKAKIHELGLQEYISDQYLNIFFFEAPPAKNANYYCNRIISYAQRRVLNTISEQVIQDVNEREPNIGSIVASATERLNNVVNIDADIDLRDLSAPIVLTHTIEELRSRLDRKILGITTGFSQLDAVTNGLKPGELIIIAGRPASGKSTFAMNIAEYCGYIMQDFAKPVCIFTLEMPSNQVMLRSIARLGSINQKAIAGHNLSEDDWSRLYAAADQISKSQNVFIDDSSYGLTVEKVRSRVRQIAQKFLDENGEPQMGLVVVDYLQLLEAEQNFRDRHLLIAHIAKSLKALAREFKCPVLALSQLNRNVDTRGPDARPTNADLRESGAIEQDADIVIMVHRPETNAPPEKKEELKGKAEIIITKNRQGEIGTIYCRFEGHYSRFVDDDASRFVQG